jgi:hypothetical protein
MDVSGQLHGPADQTPWKDPPPQYPLDKRLGGPQNRSGHGGEENIPSRRRDSNPDHLIVQLVVSYPGFILNHLHLVFL